MHELLRAHPDRFVDVRDDNIVKILERFLFEDWNRSYEICRAYWRMSLRLKLDRSEEIKVQKQNKLAIQLLFLTDARPVHLATNEVMTLAAANTADYIESSNEIEENNRPDAPLQPVDRLRLDDLFHRDFAQSFQNITTNLQQIDE